MRKEMTIKLTDQAWSDVTITHHECRIFLREVGRTTRLGGGRPHCSAYTIVVNRGRMRDEKYLYANLNQSDNSRKHVATIIQLTAKTHTPAAIAQTVRTPQSQ